MTNTNLLLSIIKNIETGSYDDAHDDAYCLPTKVGRKIQLAIQTNRDKDALLIARLAIGNI